MITKRKLHFFSSEIELDEFKNRKKIHSEEEENKIIIKFHKNINMTNLNEKVFLLLNLIIIIFFYFSWNK